MFLMKAPMSTKKLVEISTTEFDRQMASQHDKHNQVKFVPAMTYGQHDRNQ